MMEPVPLQDVERLKSNPNIAVLQGPRAADHLPRHGPEARRAAVLQREGQEPVQGQVRVRQAFYQAIDIEAIKTRVMRNAATPTGLMVAPGSARASWPT